MIADTELKKLLNFTNLLLKVSVLPQQTRFFLDQAAKKHPVQNQHRRASMAESVQAYPLLLGRIRKDIAYPRRLYTDLSKIEPTIHPRIEIWVFVQIIKDLRHLCSEMEDLSSIELIFT